MEKELECLYSFRDATFIVKTVLIQKLGALKVGQEWTSDLLKKLILLASDDTIQGLSILGGEPLCDENFTGVKNIAMEFRGHDKKKNKDIWLWTGYEFEDIYNDPQKRTILEYIDYMICGQFIDEQKNLKLKWAGSDNQRWIDVKKSLEEGKVVLAGNMLD